MIRWQRVNDQPYQYAIQQGPHGDEFVKLLDGACLRRDLPWRPMEEALALIPVYKPDGYNAHWRCLLRLSQGQATEDYVTLGWAYWVPPSSRSPDKPALLRWGCPTGQCWPKFWMPLPDVSDG